MNNTARLLYKLLRKLKAACNDEKMVNIVLGGTAYITKYIRTLRVSIHGTSAVIRTFTQLASPKISKEFSAKIIKYSLG